jgi:hypothetical protein
MVFGATLSEAIDNSLARLSEGGKVVKIKVVKATLVEILHRASEHIGK